MRYLSILLLLLSLPAFAEEKKAKNEIACAKKEDLEKIMSEKGYSILMNMTNKDGVVETLWVGGQSALLTAQIAKGEQSCLLDTMDSVTYNPYVIEEIMEVYKKQTHQKDI